MDVKSRGRKRHYLQQELWVWPLMDGVSWNQKRSGVSAKRSIGLGIESLTFGDVWSHVDSSASWRWDARRDVSLSSAVLFCNILVSGSKTWSPRGGTGAPEESGLEETPRWQNRGLLKACATPPASSSVRLARFQDQCCLPAFLLVNRTMHCGFPIPVPPLHCAHSECK